MRIITWNVNGVRPRIEQLAEYVALTQPDVLCLQETKVENKTFPADAFKEMGFADCFFHGQKSYNGVAIAVRQPGAIEQRRVFVGKDDCRHISVVTPQGVAVHNFYVPSGGDSPDPAVNEKFDHKLKFLAEMTGWFAGSEDGFDPGQHQVLVGDLNVAPLENDVWNHKVHRKQVGHTPGECDALLGAMAAANWTDAVRHFTPPAEPLFSWWTYRSPTALEKNRGWRLDHAWVTASLVEHLKDCQVDQTPRRWTRPSDHTPVILDLELT